MSRASQRRRRARRSRTGSSASVRLDAPDAARDAIERLQRTAGNRAVARLLPSGVRGQVDPAAERLLPGSGRHLDDAERAPAEAVTGHDFAEVTLHTDEVADRLTRLHGARALTIGGDIAVARGAYQEGTAEGDRLILHELVHVGQQAQGLDAGAAFADPAATEIEARTVAAAPASAPDGVREAAPPGIPQPDTDREAQAEWDRIARLFEKSDDRPGPVHLAEGIVDVLQKAHDLLGRTEGFPKDTGPKQRIRDGRAAMERIVTDIAEMVGEIEADMLRQITDGLEEAVDGIRRLERMKDLRRDGRAAGQAFDRLFQGLGKVGDRVTSGRWQGDLRLLERLRGLYPALFAALAGGGGRGAAGGAEASGQEET